VSSRGKDAARAIFREPQHFGQAHADAIEPAKGNPGVHERHHEQPCDEHHGERPRLGIQGPECRERKRHDGEPEQETGFGDERHGRTKDEGRNDE